MAPVIMPATIATMRVAMAMDFSFLYAVVIFGDGGTHVLVNNMGLFTVLEEARVIARSAQREMDAIWSGDGAPQYGVVQLGVDRAYGVAVPLVEGAQGPLEQGSLGPLEPWTPVDEPSDLDCFGPRC
jgi:hypothetical protein